MVIFVLLKERKGTILGSEMMFFCDFFLLLSTLLIQRANSSSETEILCVNELDTFSNLSSTSSTTV